MLDLFSYDFVIRALLIGTITSITTAILGNFIVAARQSVMSDMLAHTALAGVGIGIFFHVSPSLVAFVVSIIVSIILWYFLQRSSRAPEAMAMLLLSGGLATALFFAHLAKNNPISFESFLFGSIITVTFYEVVYYGIINIGVLLIILLLWDKLVGVVFDIPYMHTRIACIHVYEMVFMVLIGIIVASALKVIGGLLVGALFVIPALCAQNNAQSFKKNVIYSILYAVVSIWIGISISFYWDIPTSSSIIFVLIACFLFSRILNYISLKSG